MHLQSDIMSNDLDTQILNEIYFGKNIRTKVLEKACGCFLKLLKNPANNDAIMDLHQIYTKIGNDIEQLKIQKDKFLHINSYDIDYSKNVMKNAINRIKNNFKLIDVKINTPLGYSIFILESLFKIIFGFNNFHIVIVSKKNNSNHTFSPSTIPIQIRMNFINNTSTRNNLVFKDDYGRILSADNIINAINVKNNGISFDWKRCAFSSILTIPEYTKDYDLTPGEFLSVLLHEIGHNFFWMVLPHDHVNSTERANEKFADKFIALYGYGLEFINFKKKIDVIKNYIYYRNFKNNNPNSSTKEFLFAYKNEIDEKMKYDQFEIKDNLSRERIQFEIEKLKKDLEKDKVNNKLTKKDKEQIQQKIDEYKKLLIYTTIPIEDANIHPLSISRLESQLQQLNVELKNNITSSQRKRIINDINKIKKEINKIKHGEYDVRRFKGLNDNDYQEFQAVHKMISHYQINNRKDFDKENDAEYMSKLDSRIIMASFDNLHAKTKRESLMITNFKQFFAHFLDKNSDSNKCTFLFEKYLVSKYEKNIEESIIEYAQRIIRIKINEFITLCLRKYEISSKKYKGVKSDIIHIIQDTVFQYEKENDNLSSLKKEDFDFANVVASNKIFISPIRFNSSEKFEEIAYDQDEMKRIIELYRKYYP